MSMNGKNRHHFGCSIIVRKLIIRKLDASLRTIQCLIAITFAVTAYAEWEHEIFLVVVGSLVLHATAIKWSNIYNLSSYEMNVESKYSKITPGIFTN